MSRSARLPKVTFCVSARAKKCPLMGLVLDGRSSVDESMVSGEPIPVEKTAGDKVVGGTINGTGSLVMKAERVGAATLLAQIVNNGQRSTKDTRPHSTPRR